MVKYLKKKKLHEIAKQLCDDMSKLKDCEYTAYRGFERLRWFSDEYCDDGYITFILYCDGKRIALEKIQHLDSAFKSVTLNRKVFALETLEVIYNYA